MAAEHIPIKSSLVTVAICTHNRAQAVGLCLRSLCAQAKEHGFHVIVIDSCSDFINAVELRKVSKNCEVNYLRLEVPGLSHARNAAYEHANSEWIVYLDDDAIPTATWAKSLISSLSRAPAEVVIVGGRIIPKWPDNTHPTHITSRWMLLLSCVDRDGSGLVSKGYNICGANLAVKRHALEKINGFPTKLGRNGKYLISGEESYVIEKLFGLGLLSAYDSTFVVWHSIAPERLETRWVSKRAYWEGISRIQVFKNLGQPIPFNMSIRPVVTLPLLFLLSLVLKDPDYKIRYKFALGSLLSNFFDLVRSD